MNLARHSRWHGEVARSPPDNQKQPACRNSKEMLRDGDGAEVIEDPEKEKEKAGIKIIAQVMLPTCAEELAHGRREIAPGIRIGDGRRGQGKSEPDGPPRKLNANDGQ